MRIFLVRHGETDFNKKNLVQGRMDIPLNDNGRRQIREILPLLEEGRIIHSSPLKRTLESALIIAEAYSLDVTINDLLIERNMGVWEGKPIEDYRKAYQNIGKVNYKPPGGESYLDVYNRIEQFFVLHGKDLEDAIITTHGGVIRVALSFLCGIDLNTALELEIRNSEVIEVRGNFGNMKFSILTKNSKKIRKTNYLENLPFP